MGPVPESDAPVPAARNEKDTDVSDAQIKREEEERRKAEEETKKAEEETKKAEEEKKKEEEKKEKLITLYGYGTKDLMGIAGFVLGLFSTIFVISGIIQGYDLTFFVPEQIELRCYPTEELVNPQGKADWACTGGAKLTITGSAMSYANEGQPGFNAMITHEAVFATFPDRTLELSWHWFSNIGEESLSQTVAGPFVVPGRFAVSHETQFHPRVDPTANQAQRYRNIYQWKDFLAAITAQPADKPFVINLRFVATVFGEEEPRTGSCKVTIDEAAVQKWKDRTIWMYAQTFPCIRD